LKNKIEITEDMPDIVRKHEEQRIRRMLAKDLEMQGSFHEDYNKQIQEMSA